MQLLADRSSHLIGKIYEIAHISPIGLIFLISKLSLTFLDIFSPLCPNIQTLDCHNFIAVLGIWRSECPLHIIQNYLLLLCMNFTSMLLISMKMTVGILMRVAFSLQVILGKTVILLILILLTDKNNTLFY